MKKYFCDRCGKEVEVNDVSVLVVMKPLYDSTDCPEFEEELGDFCSSCERKIRRFIEKKEF